MSERCFWDKERGMVMIRRHPEARLEYALTPQELRLWAASGTRPEAIEPARCPTCGRVEDCCCPDCPHCDENGRPHVGVRERSR